jgi:hypothetical protein
MKDNTFFGNYLGIVVQNNDPYRRGRVKVFVPHVSPSVYSGWNELNKDKKFKFIGKNLNSDLTDILEDLKKILPWAECASPLVGENTSGRFNASLVAGSISDSSKKSSFLSNISGSSPGSNTSLSQNYDNIGEKPGNTFDINYFRLKDAFTNPGENNVNNINKHSFNYTPDVYSNSAKGSFSIPAVGSHLWVFFAAGNPLKPVYFASSFGTSDWNSIYYTGSAGDTSNNNVRADLGIDYPGTFENKNTNSTELTYNAETYRNKFVINQKGGTLAFVNTDNKESVKLSHYSGSFKEMNNFTSIELATKNDQKLVLEDSFLTVRGDRNEFTERDYDLNVVGNFYKKIGKIDSTLASQWKEIVKELADTKQLFEIQRSKKVENTLIKFSSSKQKRSGSFAQCPVCKGSKDLYFVYNISYKKGFKNEMRTSFSDCAGNYAYGQTIDGKKSLQYPGAGGSYVYTLPVTTLSNTIDGSSFSSSPSKFLGDDPCPACGGSGTSKSTFDGKWTKEEKENLINRFFTSNLTKLSEIEKKLGLGGNEIIEIAKHKIETIGTVMNDFGSIRIDEIGKMEPSEVIIHEYGTFLNRKPTPIVEYVNVTDLPGGNYTLNVSNRFNLLVGAGGINMKSFGPVNISGTITNVAGEQVNVASENEVNIDGGKRVSIVGDVVSIRQRNRKQVLVDSSLGVSKNAIILGGAYVEGELHVQHVTAPMEVQETNKTVLYGASVSDTSNSNGAVIGFGVTLSNFPVKNPIPGKGYMMNPVPGIVGPPYIGFTDITQIVGYIMPGMVATWANPLLCPGACTLPGPNLMPIPIFGSGPANMCVKGSDMVPGVGNTPSLMTVALYGSGRDDDSIVIPEHSHLFKNLPLTLTQTNREVREQAINLCQSSRNSSVENTGAGGEAAPNGPIINAPK